jgi:hypothetical protein
MDTLQISLFKTKNSTEYVWLYEYIKDIDIKWFTDKIPLIISLGYLFGFGYTSGRISARILAHNVFHWKGRTFYEGGQ